MRRPRRAARRAPGGEVPRVTRWSRPRLSGPAGLAAVLLLAIVFSPMRGGRPVFLDIGNLTDILRQVAEKGILAVGMTAVVISGGIDLSVGSVLALAATLSAWLLMDAGIGRAARRRDRPRGRRLCGASTACGRPLAAPALHRDARDDERGPRRGAVPQRRRGDSARLRRRRRARVVPRAGGARRPVRAGAGGALPAVGGGAIASSSRADAWRALPLRHRRQRVGGAALGRASRPAQGAVCVHLRAGWRRSRARPLRAARAGQSERRCRLRARRDRRGRHRRDEPDRRYRDGRRHARRAC